MKIIASSKGVSRWIFSYYYFTFDNVVLDKKNAERFQKKKFEKRKIRDLKFEKKNVYYFYDVKENKQEPVTYCTMRTMYTVCHSITDLSEA